uniref:Protein kinase domain-containing protein n=1 Tax=Psilocybe cubensis TaxID=181762 RepID=A0A8H7Y536_PSICU
MAHARRSPQHRATSPSVSSPSTTRKNSLRRSTSRTSSRAPTEFIPSTSFHTLRPVLVPLESNLRRQPSRTALTHKVDGLDQLMRDPGHVIAGSKRKRVTSSNENAHTHGRPTRGSGRLKRLRTTSETVSRYRRASTSEESRSEASEMEVDTRIDTHEEDTEGSDDEECPQGGYEDEEHYDSSDEFLLHSASPKRLNRLLKLKLVELYELCGLTGTPQSLTKHELVDAIVNNRDGCASVPPSSPLGKGDGASSEYSSDDAHFAGDEETDAGGSRLPSHGSPLKRRVTTHDFGAAPLRPLKNRSLSMGNISGNNEVPRSLISERKLLMQLDAKQIESTGPRRKNTARSSPATSTTTSSLKSSPPATRLRSRNVSVSANSSVPEPTSRGKGKGKAKQVEFSNEVEIHESSLKLGSRGKEVQTLVDSESDLTELEEEEEEEVEGRREPVGIPSPRRLRSKDRETERSVAKQVEDPDVTPIARSKQQRRIRGVSHDRTMDNAESSTNRNRRVTPMRKAKRKVGNLKESDPEDRDEEKEADEVQEEGEEEEEEEEEDLQPGNNEDDDDEAGEEDEVDELISSASITPPPESHGRRTPLRRRLRPRKSRNRVAPTVDEENEGDDEEEAEGEEGEEGNDGEEDEEDDVEGNQQSIADDGDDEVTIAVEPRKLRNGKIVGEEDTEMDVDEESVADQDEDGEVEDEVDDAASIDVDAEGETDEDETMEDDVDLTVATAKTLVRMRRDDLVRLCETRDLDPSGTKPQLAEALLQWRDRQGNDFSSPSSGGTVRPASKKKKRTKHHSDSTNTAVPVLLRSAHNHTDEPRTPVPGKDKEGKDKENEELELDLESLGLEDREIPPEKLTKLEKIGSGGFKDVFIGKFKNRKIAISEFRGQLSTMDIKELKLLGAFNHPNIVRFLGVSIPENTKETPVMIVSELCSNGDLFDYIRNTNAPSLRKVLLMMLDIARGLEYLHTRKPSIIHRDCKSSNILITAKGTAKIADFGLAKVKQSTRSMVRSLVGTVNWQAPELWTAHPKYNHKVDTFSCAMVYWEMLQWHAQTKKFPWEGMNEHAIYEIVGAKRQRPPINNLRKQWCPEIVDLMERMWAQEHQDRPTMTEVVKALEELLATY